MRLASYPSQPVVGVSLHRTLLLHGAEFLLFSYFFVVFTVKPRSRDYFLLELWSRGLYENTVIYVSEPITRPLVKVSDHLFCFELIGFQVILGSSFFLLFSSGFLAAYSAQGSAQLSVLQMRFSVESKG